MVTRVYGYCVVCMAFIKLSLYIILLVENFLEEYTYSTLFLHYL